MCIVMGADTATIPSLRQAPDVVCNLNVTSFCMRLFKKKDERFQISSAFRENIQKAINLLLNSNNSPTDEMVLDLFQKNGMNQVDSIEILLFLPIAFCRRLFDHFKWHDTYIEQNGENNYVEKKFADSVSFQIIWQETEKYFQNLPVSKEILKIVGRSAEFNVLNDLLLQNPDTKAEDIILSKIHILR